MQPLSIFSVRDSYVVFDFATKKSLASGIGSYEQAQEVLGSLLKIMANKESATASEQTLSRPITRRLG